MKKLVLLSLAGLLSVSCNGQEKDEDSLKTDKTEALTETQPKGSWKVDKEFDENGNLIRYDSIYSWSSSENLENLSLNEKDSLLQSFKSRFFTSFSDNHNQRFESIFSQDSLFSNQFFNDDFFNSDFGEEFMNLDKLRQQMVDRQKKFLEKYQSEFIKPEDENE